MAAKEKKTEAAPTKKPTTRRAMSRKAAAPEITQEMIAERAYHISLGGARDSPGEEAVAAWPGPRSSLQLSCIRPKRSAIATNRPALPSTMRRWVRLPLKRVRHITGSSKTVESAWGAVSMLPSVRFPRPLAEHAVCVSTQLALHGICR